MNAVPLLVGRRVPLRHRGHGMGRFALKVTGYWYS